MCVENDLCNLNTIERTAGILHLRYALLQHADVVLDSYPFGGYTTSLQALALGTICVCGVCSMADGRAAASSSSNQKTRGCGCVVVLAFQARPWSLSLIRSCWLGELCLAG